MTTDHVTNGNTLEEYGVSRADSPRALRSISLAVKHARENAESTPDALDSISSVMGTRGIAPDPVDHARYTLRELAKLREAIQESSFAIAQHAVEGHGASVKELAKASGISHTTLYRRLGEPQKAAEPVPPFELEGKSPRSRLFFGFNNHDDELNASAGEPDASRRAFAYVSPSETRWLSIYGATGSGKTNVAGALVFGAASRNWPVTVLAGPSQDYAFAGNAASVISEKAHALKELSNRILNRGIVDRKTPHLIVIEDLPNFMGETHNPSGTFMAMTYELKKTIAEVIARAEELNLVVVTTVQDVDRDIPSDHLHQLWREASDEVEFDPAQRSHLVMAGSMGLLERSDSHLMRTVRSISRWKAVLHRPGHEDVLVSVWDSSDNNKLAYPLRHR